MKEQILHIRCSDGEVSYRFVTGSGRRLSELVHTLNGADRFVPVDDTIMERILTETAAMLAEFPDHPAPAPPVISEVILADHSRHFLPDDLLFRLLDDAWIDGEYLRSALDGPQLMGAVQAPDITGFTTGMMGMMNTAALSQSWQCPNCGTEDLHGRFCPECGTPKPQ